MTNRRRERTGRVSRAGQLVAAAAIFVLATTDATAQRFGSDGELGRGRLFSLPRSQDDIHQWRQAQTDVAEGRLSDAVERLHELLRRGQHGVVPSPESAEIHFGLKAAVLRTLRSLPEEGRTTYEKLTEREAGRLLRTAFDSRSTEPLQALAEGFPTSEAGLQARLRLGALALEEGDGIAATLHFRAALDGMRPDAPERDTARRGMGAAQVLAGRRPRARDASDLDVIFGQLAAVLPGGEEPLAVDRYGAGRDNDGVMTSPLGDLRLQRRVDIRARGFRGQLYPMQAVGDINGIIINDGLSAYCIDPLTGDALWQAPGPLVDEPASSLHDYEASINRDMILAAACTDDVVIAALQIPRQGRSERFRHIDVIRRIPRRRLFAFDRSTGKRLWSHWSDSDDESSEFDGHNAAGPPLIRGDTVYVASHDDTGAIAYYLTAYDLATGATRWRTLICSSQGEVNMFGNSRREYAASPLVMHEGMLLGTTNLGVCFSANAADGEVRWVTAYEVIPLPETRLTDQRDRDVVFSNNPLYICDGVVACTPLDSAYALGLDCETGEQLWRVYHRAHAQRTEIRWLLGATDDEFVFSGLGVLAVKARPEPGESASSILRRVRSADSLGIPAETYTSSNLPRGALTDDLVYFATPAGLRTFTERGDTKPSRLVAGEVGLGNLLLVDGILASVRAGSLELFYDRAKLVADAEQRVRRNPQDPAALLRLATLVGGSAGSGLNSERAEKYYRKGLDLARRAGMGPQSSIYRRLATELFQLSMTRARELRPGQPDRALELMRTARDTALVDAQWLAAQRVILQWVRDDRANYLVELDQMDQRFGGTSLRFPEYGRIPVSAFVLWETARVTDDARRAVTCCQELIERYGDVALGNDSARDLARDRQKELLEQHGDSVYADVEASARVAYTDARGDLELLRALVDRFPHSRSARNALDEMMDLAVERGDLGTAARSYAQALSEGQARPGVVRRMLAAAEKAGNVPLATTLAEQLLRDFGQETSDFRPDEGRKLSEVITPPVAIVPHRPAPPTELPIAVTAQLAPRESNIGLRLCRARVVDGFPAPDRSLLFVSVDAKRLEAYDTGLGSRMFDEPLFSAPFDYTDEDEILLCGDTLIVTEFDRIRGLDLETGDDKWSVEAQSERLFISLGCQRGVLHVFSEFPNASDGGALLGIEPLTGTLLFRHEFPATAECIPPCSSNGALWIFRSGNDDEAPVILELDPLTGGVRSRIPLSTPLLARLGMTDPDTRSYMTLAVHRSLFSDADLVFLSVNGDSRNPPRIAAVSRDGRERWLWRGMTGRKFLMAAPFEDNVVVTETGDRNTRVVVLDRNSGSVRREKVLGPDVQIRNWRPSLRGEPAPDALMLVDRRRSGLRLTCFGLGRDIPSFSHNLNGQYEYAVSQPVRSDDFIALGARRRDNYLTLFVLDPKTQRSLLPRGDTKLRLPLGPPFKMHTAGPHVVIESNEGLSVLGPEAR